MDRIVAQLQHYFADKPINRAFVFGSYARQEEQADSDIDILVELDYAHGADFFFFIDLKEELSTLLNRSVDVVSANGLSKFIQPRIDQEKQLIYEKAPEQ